MAGPWEKYAQPQQAAGPWTKYAQPSGDSGPVEQAKILPASKDAQGNWSFDSNAGVLGDFKRALGLPGAVYRGEVPTMQPDMGQGITSQALIERSAQAGAQLSPMSPTARAVSRALTPKSMAQRPIPTREQLKEVGGGQIQEALDMGVDFDPSVIAQFASMGRAVLDKGHWNEKAAPNTYEILRSLENPPGGIDLAGLEQARRQLYEGAASDSDRKAGKYISDALDKFMQNPPEAAVLAGPAQAAAGVLKQGRGNWAAYKRSKKIGEKQEYAKFDTDAANSGANLDNSLRRYIASILKNEKARAKFSEAEQKEMKAFVEGGKGRNFLRKWSNTLGGGGGLGRSLTAASAFGSAGYLGGGPLGAFAGVAAPLTGAAMKVGQNRLARKGVNQLDEMTRMRSPLYGTAAMPPLPPSSMLGAQTMASPLRIYLNADERDKQMGR